MQGAGVTACFPRAYMVHFQCHCKPLDSLGGWHCHHPISTWETEAKAAGVTLHQGRATSEGVSIVVQWVKPHTCVPCGHWLESWLLHC